MSFLLSEAYAADSAPAPAAAPDPLMSFLPLILIFVVFYFFLIRPQTKRAKEHKKMLEGLAKGDEIVTNGGLLGRITELGDHFVAVEVAANVQVKVQRQAIANLMPKGTAKGL